MPTLAYFVHGRGRGHALRAHATVPRLRQAGYDVRVFAGGDAVRLLEADQHFQQVRPCMPGPRLLRDFLFRVRRDLATLRALQPELVITDGDLSSGHAASLLGIPRLAIGHGLIFRHGELPKQLSGWAKLREAINAGSSSWMCTHRVAVHFFPITPRTKGTVIARPDLPELSQPETATSSDGFALTYFRDGNGDDIIRALLAQGHSVVNFGTTSVQAERLVSHSHSVTGFQSHLRRCRFVVASAGNHLPAECAMLGKQMIAVWRTGDTEQEMNARMVEHAGIGLAAPIQEVDALFVQRFNKWLATAQPVSSSTESMLPTSEAIRAAVQDLVPLDHPPTDPHATPPAVQSIQTPSQMVRESPPRAHTNAHAAGVRSAIAKRVDQVRTWLGSMQSDGSKKLTQWLFTLAIAAYLLFQLRDLDLRQLLLTLPTNPAFYGVFALRLFILPASEVMIYQGLWRTPLWPAFGAFLRKRSYNFGVADLSGEAYFAFWAKSHLALPTSKVLHSIKDVNILSAVVSSAATVILALVAGDDLLQWLGQAPDAITATDLAATGMGPYLTATVLVSGLVALLALVFWRRIVRLSLREFWMVFSIHSARMGLTLVTQVLLYALAIPLVPLPTWLGFVAIHMLIHRIPLLPARELVFTSAALAFSATVDTSATEIASMLITLAALNQVANVVLYLAAPRTV